MKRNHLFIIMDQSVIIVLMLVYSLWQRNIAQAAAGEASAQRALAEKHREEAEQLKLKANRLQLIADQNVFEAMRQVEFSRQQAQKSK